MAVYYRPGADGRNCFPFTRYKLRIQWLNRHAKPQLMCTLDHKYWDAAGWVDRCLRLWPNGKRIPNKRFYLDGGTFHSFICPSYNCTLAGGR
jgi:hypothetical protein